MADCNEGRSQKVCERPSAFPCEINLPAEARDCQGGVRSSPGGSRVDPGCGRGRRGGQISVSGGRRIGSHVGKAAHASCLRHWENACVASSLVRLFCASAVGAFDALRPLCPAPPLHSSKEVLTFLCRWCGKEGNSSSECLRKGEAPRLGPLLYACGPSGWRLR